MIFQPLSAAKCKSFRQIQEKRYRKTNRIFLIEGLRIFEESMKVSRQPVWIAVTEDFLNAHPAVLQFLKHFHKEKTFLATEIQIRQLSDTEQSQGIIAAMPAEVKPLSAIYEPDDTTPVIALDRISDPGNLGTICRCADWFGVRHVVMNAACVEWHNPKAVRGSMGSVFRVTGYENADLLEFLPAMRNHGYEVYTAVIDENASAAFQSPSVKSVLVIGSEAHGIHPDIMKHGSQRIRIPRYGNAESLNAAVACGILLHDLSRLIYRS